MKKVLFLIILFATSLELVAQTKSSISLNLFGDSNTFGINYEKRFSDCPKWGLRVGLSYGYDSNTGLLNENLANSESFSIPIDLNYISGQGKNHFEFGLGISNGLYKEEDIFKKKTINDWGFFVYSNIGYRFQGRRGIIFRTGLTPSLNLGGKHGVQRSALIYPYISLGYTF